MLLKLKTREMITDDVFGIERALEQRGLLGSVFITEPKVIGSWSETPPVRLESLRPLSRESALELRETLIDKAADLLGDNPGDGIFLRPMNSGRPSRRVLSPGA